MPDFRCAEPLRDRSAVPALWLAYLRGRNDATETRSGPRLPVREAVDGNLAHIERRRTPEGGLLLASAGDAAIGMACLRITGPDTAEIKRMVAHPSSRREKWGRSLPGRLIDSARPGFRLFRFYGPDCMTAAHARFRSAGSVEIGPHPERGTTHPYEGRRVFNEKNLD